MIIRPLRENTIEKYPLNSLPGFQKSACTIISFFITTLHRMYFICITKPQLEIGRILWQR